MAKIKLSPLATDIAGSLDGLLFSKSRGVNTVRRKVIPINPNTLAQRISRWGLGQLMSINKQMHLFYRNSWDDLAEGASQTAVNLYLKQTLSDYINVNDLSLSPHTSVPVITGSQGTPDNDTQPVEILFSPSPIPAGVVMYVYSTVPVDDSPTSVLLLLSAFAAGLTSPRFVLYPDLSGGDLRISCNFLDTVKQRTGYGFQFLVNFI